MNVDVRISTDSISRDDQAVYVIDDDRSACADISALMRSVGILVKSYTDPEDFLAGEMPNSPSCLILDVRLRGQSGFLVQRRVLANDMRIPIIFLTAHGDIAMSVRAMKAGATDFLTKPFRDQDLLDAVSEAIELDRRRRLADQHQAEAKRNYELLTARERQVMTLVAQGLRNGQIAAELCVAEVTVRIHRKHAMKKMRARSLAHFVRLASTLRLLSSAPIN